MIFKKTCILFVFMIKEIIGTMKSSSPNIFHVTISLFAPDTDNVTCFIQNHNNLVTNFVQNKYIRKNKYL